MEAGPESNEGSPRSVHREDGATVTSPFLPRPSMHGRDKTTIRKLENTVDFLRAELASEAKCKDVITTALTKSESAYSLLQAEMRKMSDALEQKRTSDLQEARAQHKREMDARAAEVQ